MTYRYCKISHILLFSAFSLLSVNSFSQKAFSKLVWSDEFNYKGLPDSSKWGYDVGTGCPALCGWGNNESQFYTNKRLENARVKGGKLLIETRKENFQGAQYTSARLTSKNKGDWTYGRFEIKARLPKGLGMWSAIWMLPTNLMYGGWPKSGEIDIMENVGYLPDSLFGTVHTGAYNGMMGTQRGGNIFCKTMASKFHVYAVEWTAEEVAFFIDNIKFHSFKNEHTNTDAWPYDQPFHILMNIAVGGNWGGKFGIDNAVFPQRMEVDYVRVYQ